MGTIKISSEEYKELLTIKSNAFLLSLSMNVEFKDIVYNLCKEHTKNSSKRHKAQMEKLDEEMEQLQKDIAEREKEINIAKQKINENRH